jgi:hypothetical protein
MHAPPESTFRKVRPCCEKQEGHRRCRVCCAKPPSIYTGLSRASRCQPQPTAVRRRRQARHHPARAASPPEAQSDCCLHMIGWGVRFSSRRVRFAWGLLVGACPCVLVGGALSLQVAACCIPGSAAPAESAGVARLRVGTLALVCTLRVLCRACGDDCACTVSFGVTVLSSGLRYWCDGSRRLNEVAWLRCVPVS